MKRPNRRMIDAMKDRQPSRKAVLANLNAFRPVGMDEITLKKTKRGKLPDDPVGDL